MFSSTVRVGQCVYSWRLRLLGLRPEIWSLCHCCESMTASLFNGPWFFPEIRVHEYHKARRRLVARGSWRKEVEGAVSPKWRNWTTILLLQIKKKGWFPLIRHVSSADPEVLIPDVPNIIINNGLCRHWCESRSCATTTIKGTLSLSHSGRKK